ncbi:MAG: hypothetical protein NC218_09415 [Acetobacter sp.]|nr:hypothetical protein [Acetobacter sp.]
MAYLINVTNVYRVPTVADALALRKEIENGPGEIASFTYTTKFIKEKGEIVEEYQQVKVKIVFNEEKEPESGIREMYGSVDLANGEDF